MADQLYAFYAEGRDLRRLVAIIGEEALTEIDRKYLKFAEGFEKVMINQGQTDRSIVGAEQDGAGEVEDRSHVPTLDPAPAVRVW